MEGNNIEKVLIKSKFGGILLLVLSLVVLIIGFVLLDEGEEEYGVTAISIALFVFFVWLYGACSKVVVTDKMVYGIFVFGKQAVSLKRVSYVEYGWLLGTLTIGTPSGRIRIMCVRNSRDIYDLLVNKQIDKA